MMLISLGRKVNYHEYMVNTDKDKLFLSIVRMSIKKRSLNISGLLASLEQIMYVRAIEPLASTADRWDVSTSGG